jgi:hypothetical protein
VTERERRVAALAAAFAKERAPGLVGRMSTPGAADAVRLAGCLAAATRIERLRAFAAAVSTDTATAREAADAAAAFERPAVARLLVAVGVGDPMPACSPLLVRVARERIGR